MTPISKGNCYLCGATFAKNAMKSHILKNHTDLQGEQKCSLLKVESADNKNYWLFIDLPTTATLSKIDAFLRLICWNAAGI